ncbi:MAG: sel1 repeat family protein [Methylococcales symbiont of Iophon sp. n. MRB-2018]|nr:MAG: sel1 repeat family protein [Methylococcales symbiont of Iophon sp. n. MRB-2018]
MMFWTMYYTEGEGVKQNHFKAVEFYQKACALDDGEGCNNLGFMYDKGEGVRQSTQKALEYYGEACDLESQLGCENYAKTKNQ